MRVKEITADKIYVLETGEGKWRYILLLVDDELIVTKCSGVRKNE